MTNTTITQAEFTRILDSKAIPHETRGGKLIVNGGGVYLPSLKSESQPYRGQTIRLKKIDLYTMLIRSEKRAGEYTLYKAAYFGGGDLDKLRLCWVAQDGEYYAHGGTARAAIRDVQFKRLAAEVDVDELVAEVRERGMIRYNDFRLLTGACDEGLRHGLQELGLDPELEEMPLAGALRLSRGKYGGERMQELFEEEVT